MRLDSYLVETALVKSRERAKKLIKDGCVSVNGEIRLKPAFDVGGNDTVYVDDSSPDYVGRGRFKLEEAFQAFDLDIYDKVCADIGASTGGFTQCMLSRGARLVYAVDVGHGQLDEKIAADSRVVNCEGVNARYLTADFFEYPPEFISMDLSFISLSLVIPAVSECLACNGEIAVLIKPQFEAGKSALNKKGIVKSKKDHIRVLENVFALFKSCGLTLIGAVSSPIMGGDGNIEYLAYVRKRGVKSDSFTVNILPEKLVDTAFSLFDKKG